MKRSPRQGWAGTRSRTGPAHRSPDAGTTWVTGPAAMYLSARSSSSVICTSPRRTCRASAVPSSTMSAYADTWSGSLDSALSNDPDHVSAYALIVEEGTALARQVRRGEVQMTDDDDLADKYIAAGPVTHVMPASGLR